MKIIQTLWTRPGLSGGWLNPCYHLMSWALSCLQLRKHYDQVELYTDRMGKELLVDCFKLPYTRVHTILDEMHYPDYCWAVPKIHVYGLQDAPFLHVDGDIFIWNKFFGNSIDHGVIYQNLEFETTPMAFYSITIDMLLSTAADEKLPEWITHFWPGEVQAINAGVFGGNDISFFKEHTRRSFAFLDTYSALFKRMKFPQTINHLLEQVMSRIMLDELNVSHRGLLPHMRLELTKEETAYELLNHFGISPYGVPYTHLIGHLKTDQQISRMLANRLFISYPDHYRRIVSRFNAGLLQAEDDDYKWAHNILTPGYVKRHATNAAHRVKSMRHLAADMSPETVFFRTLLLHERFCHQKPPQGLSIAAFTQWLGGQLQEIADARIKERLLDVFAFEQERHQYISSIDDDEDYHTREQEMTTRIDWLYSPAQPDLEQLSFSLNNRYGVVYSRWDWTKKHNLEKLSANFRVKGSQVQTVITADMLFRQVTEYNVTNLCQALLYVFAEQRTYYDGLNALAEFIDDPWHPDTQEHIFQGLVYLVISNILTVHKVPAETLV